MKIALALLVLALSCTTATGPAGPAPTDFDWVRPANNYEVKFREARALAEQIMRHPVCRAQFEQLPDWPTGPVPTEIIWNEGLSKRVRAFTDMQYGRVYLLVQTLRSSSVEHMARTLIHELGHVASKSDYEQIRQLNEEKDVQKIQEIKHKNELRVQRVTRRCMRAAGIA